MPRSHLLITTAIPETHFHKSFPDAPTVCIGDWCLRGRAAKIGTTRPFMLPYHWDDQTQFEADYELARDCFEVTLKPLAERLNELHGLDKPLRFWRLLVGPWLRHFTEMLLDRWRSIECAIAHSPSYLTIRMPKGQMSVVPQGMCDFHMYFTSDEWNHALYLEVIERLGAGCITVIEASTQPERAVTAPAPTARVTRSPRRRAAHLLRSLLGPIGMQRHMLLGTYLGLPRETLLQLLSGQPPTLGYLPSHPVVDPEPARRDWRLAKATADPFLQCLHDCVPRFLPALYLEGLGTLHDVVRRSGWPRRPRTIATANLDMSHDAFMLYAAEHISHGAKLVLIQHGGNIGSAKLSSFEDMQRESCDAYLTWGWKAPGDDKIRPVGHVLPRMRRGFSRSQRDSITIVTHSAAPYAYEMHSGVLGGQYRRHLEHQIAMCRALTPALQRNLLVRLYRSDYDWGSEAQWSDQVPLARLDRRSKSLRALFSRTRLLVSTYNATSFLESFACGLPCMILLDSTIFAIRSSAQPAFDALAAAGVLHSDPLRAARHIEEIWMDVDGWWNSAQVRQAVKNFCAELNQTDGKVLRRIWNEIHRLD